MSLGQLTTAQVGQINDQLLELSGRLSAQYDIIRRAREAGFDQAVIAEALAAHERLMGQLDRFTTEAAEITTDEAFQQWLMSYRGLEAQIAAFEAEVAATMGAAGKKRTTVIVLSTIGALAVAGVVGGLIWYWSSARHRTRGSRRARGVGRAGGCGCGSPLRARG